MINSFPKINQNLYRISYRLSVHFSSIIRSTQLQFSSKDGNIFMFLVIEYFEKEYGSVSGGAYEVGNTHGDIHLHHQFRRSTLSFKFGYLSDQLVYIFKHTVSITAICLVIFNVCEVVICRIFAPSGRRFLGRKFGGGFKLSASLLLAEP